MAGQIVKAYLLFPRCSNYQQFITEAIQLCTTTLAKMCLGFSTISGIISRCGFGVVYIHLISADRHVILPHTINHHITSNRFINLVGQYVTERIEIGFCRNPH